MLRLEPGERREGAGDGVALVAALEDVSTAELAGEVSAELRAELEVLTHVDYQHGGHFTLAERRRGDRAVGPEVLTAQREVEVIADHVAAHERATDLVVARDVVVRLDVVDVEVEAERRAEREGAHEVEEEAQGARRRGGERLGRLFAEVRRRDDARDRVRRDGGR